jgi:hypothetical protein
MTGHSLVIEVPVPSQVNMLQVTGHVYVLQVTGHVYVLQVTGHVCVLQVTGLEKCVCMVGGLSVS